MGAPMADGDGGVYLPQCTEIKVGSTPTAHTRKNKTKEANFMLYSEAIELLETALLEMIEWWQRGGGTHIP